MAGHCWRSPGLFKLVICSLSASHLKHAGMSLILKFWSFSCSRVRNVGLKTVRKVQPRGECRSLERGGLQVRVLGFAAVSVSTHRCLCSSRWLFPRCLLIGAAGGLQISMLPASASASRRPSFASSGNRIAAISGLRTSTAPNRPSGAPIPPTSGGKCHCDQTTGSYH